MSEYGERELHSFFGYTANLSIDERNELEEYLNGLREFQDWDEAGLLLGLRQDLLKACARTGATAESIDAACEKMRAPFHKYKELGEILRRKVKNWCRAMVDEPA